jgi:hypothetical protein
VCRPIVIQNDDCYLLKVFQEFDSPFLSEEWCFIPPFSSQRFLLLGFYGSFSNIGQFLLMNFSYVPFPLFIIFNLIINKLSFQYLVFPGTSRNFLLSREYDNPEIELVILFEPSIPLKRIKIV